MPDPFTDSKKDSDAVAAAAADRVGTTRHRRWDWRDFGVCVLVAALLLWLAHFTLAWDRVLVGAVLLAIGFGLGHWLGRASAGGDDTGGLVHGRWGFRIFLLGLVLAVAALGELVGFSIAYWTQPDPAAATDQPPPAPRFEHFPWRFFVAGALGLILGVLAAIFGWRSSAPSPAVPATKA